MCARALTKDAVKDVEDTKTEIENTPDYNVMVQMIKDEIMREQNL